MQVPGSTTETTGAVPLPEGADVRILKSGLVRLAIDTIASMLHSILFVNHHAHSILLFFFRSACSKRHSPDGYRAAARYE